MKHARIPLVAIRARVLLWSCQGPGQMAAEGSLEQADAVYAQCVAAQSTGSAECETSRRNYESSQRSYAQSLRGAEQQPADSSWTH